MLGKIEGRKKRGQQRMRWLDGLIDSMDMSLSKLREMVKDGEAWRAAVLGIAEVDTTELRSKKTEWGLPQGMQRVSQPLWPLDGDDVSCAMWPLGGSGASSLLVTPWEDPPVPPGGALGGPPGPSWWRPGGTPWSLLVPVRPHPRLTAGGSRGLLATFPAGGGATASGGTLLCPHCLRVAFLNFILLKLSCVRFCCMAARSDLVAHRFALFHILFRDGLSQDIEYRSLCST